MPTAKLKILFAALSIGAISTGLHARTIEDVVEHERATYEKTCGDIKFGENFTWEGDLDQDRRNDVIVKSSEATCDGQPGPECNIFGCPFRIYLRLRGGVYRYVTEVRAFSFDVHYRYGVRIIDFRIAGNQCGKANLSPCTLTTRINAGKLVVLSTQ